MFFEEIKTDEKLLDFFIFTFVFNNIINSRIEIDAFIQAIGEDIMNVRELEDLASKIEQFDIMNLAWDIQDDIFSERKQILIG